MNWQNYANGDRFNLMWSKSKWRLEEMADGGPIPQFRRFGEKLDLVAHEMPILHSVVWAKIDRPPGLDAYAVKGLARVMADDSGATARRKLKEATEQILGEQLHSRPDLLPGLLRRAKWKKVP